MSFNSTGNGERSLSGIFLNGGVRLLFQLPHKFVDKNLSFRTKHVCPEFIFPIRKPLQRDFCKTLSSRITTVKRIIARKSQYNIRFAAGGKMRCFSPTRITTVR